MTNKEAELLVTKVDDVVGIDPDSGPAIERFGGIRIYAPDDQTLRLGLNQISEAILRNSKTRTHLISRYLLSLCREDLGFSLSKNVFQASLGAEFRKGNLERILCFSEKGTAFNIIVHASRIDELRRNLITVTRMAEGTDKLPVRAVQDELFPGRAKGTWYGALQVMQRLAYLGILTQMDEWNFCIPSSLINAKSNANGNLVPDDAKWLV